MDELVGRRLVENIVARLDVLKLEKALLGKNDKTRIVPRSFQWKMNVRRLQRVHDLVTIMETAEAVKEKKEKN